MGQPRLAIAAPNFHPRTCGIGDHSLRLAVELRRRGYQVEIFSRAPAAPHPEGADVPIREVPGTHALMIAEQIRRRVVAEGFSHLIIQYAPHMWNALRFGSPASVWLAAGARRKRIDVAVIAHELFTEVAPRPDLALRAALHRGQIMALSRAAHHTFATTRTRVEQLLPYWRAAGLPGSPGIVRIGPNALPAPRVRQPGRRRLGVFSTLAVTKRFDVVLGAFEHVWRRWPDSELVLIGDIGRAEDPRVAAIRAAVEAHPARDRIRTTGKLSLQEVSNEIAALDVYVFPMTTGANTRSGTLPVALGSGIPTVAVNGVETDLDLFRDGDNVLFAAAMTADAFGAAAVRILDDPALAERLSAGARELYDRHLTWERVGDDLLSALGLPRHASAAAA